jgi:adenosylcobinamide-phosphate synthase
MESLDLTHPAMVLCLATAGDLVLPRCPTRWHPVGWMGVAIGAFKRVAPRQGRVVPFLCGAAFCVGGMGSLIGVGDLIVHTGTFLPVWMSVLLQILFLKSTFAIESLARAGRLVQDPLETGDLPRAREALGEHLVSRPVSELNETQVAAATVESIAENTCDSVVAPLFYYCWGGLPAALAYRFVNTCDAMLGYRTRELEWLGKPAARLDDLLNFLPARLTALVMALAGVGRGASPRRIVAVWWRDRGLTASPNAGQAMAVAAGVLEIELEKVGAYRLGRGQDSATPVHIDRAVWLLRTTAGIVFVLSLILLIVGGSA